MSVRSQIQAALRTAVATLGETGWTYRRLTSGPATETRTYGTATAISSVHASGRTGGPEYDEQRREWKRVERQVARIPDDLAVLHQGDQVTDPAGDVWAVWATGPGADRTGSVAYQLMRDIPLAAGPNRNGGV